MMEFIYQKDGFCGRLYTSKTEPNSHIIFVLQGSGGYPHAARFAKLLAEHDMDALAIASFGAEGLPAKPARIPIDQFDSAVARLRESGYEHFGLYGTSRGAGTALLAASLIPDFSCVIVLSPVRFIYQGSGIDGSMYSYKNQDFSCVPRKGVLPRSLKRIIKERKLRLLYFMEAWEANADTRHEIPVENINGPVLLLSSAIDESLPARRHCEEMCRRLADHSFSHPYKHINYDYGSHNLGYHANVNTWALPREKHFPELCQQAREEALKETLDFIDKWCNSPK